MNQTDNLTQETDPDVPELLESLEPESDLDADVTYSQTNPPVSMKPFIGSAFPVLFIDRQFMIRYVNPSCSNLFNGLFSLTGNNFFDIFAKSLGAQSVREIRESVLNGIRGYSWKGTISTKARETGTIQTRVYLFPAKPLTKPVSGFIILFDDVTDENKRFLRSVFLSLLEASKLKDNDTGNHIERVNLYSRRLAEEVFNKPGYEEVDRDFIDDIGFLASMHDVGKIGTPDDILNKEGPLTDWEWTIMREHTKNGAFILSTYPNPMAREIALSHHERWDGKGYPFQMEGTMIPLSARIVAIADVYDAMRMRRSYKKSYDHYTAVRKIQSWRGTHFDPRLLDVFMNIHEEFDGVYSQNID